MTEHQHSHDPHAEHEPELADLLDLDADVFAAQLRQLIDWAGQWAPTPVRTVVDVGAGTGTGSLALARRFDEAETVAIDASATMLQRLRAKAVHNGLGDRVRTLRADLDAEWPAVSADLVWSASALHHLQEPDRVLADIRAALRPGGLLLVVELDDLPCFLPDDAESGLEARCHAAAARAGSNAHPDWRFGLQRAGFTVVGQRTFTAAADPASANAGRLAQAMLGRLRHGLADRLDAADLDALDRLLSDGHPDALTRRADLSVRASRTAWAARR